MNPIDTITSQMRTFQSFVIGMMKRGPSTYLITKADRSGYEGVEIGALGGITHHHLPTSYEAFYHAFPNGKNMVEMMNDPIGFDKFCKSRFL